MFVCSFLTSPPAVTGTVWPGHFCSKSVKLKMQQKIYFYGEKIVFFLGGLSLKFWPISLLCIVRALARGGSVTVPVGVGDRDREIQCLPPMLKGRQFTDLVCRTALAKPDLCQRLNVT